MKAIFVIYTINKLVTKFNTTNSALNSIKLNPLHKMEKKNNQSEGSDTY